MSHSPGPWSKEGIQLIDANKQPVVVSDGPSFGSASVWRNAEDNAKLVIASPLLAEALLNMLAAFDNPIARRKLNSEFNDEAIQSARNALQEAGVKTSRGAL